MNDIIAELLATAKRNKLRTALTGFSVAWGIFMIIFLLGAGNGLINAQKQQSNRFMDNSMMVGGGVTTKPHDGLQEGRFIQLNDRDISVTANEYPNIIDEVGATIEQSGNTVSLGENYVSTQMQGVYPNEVRINKKEMLHGRFINSIDINERRKVIVIGSDDARELWHGNMADFIGKHVNVGKMAFQVVGIYKADKSGRNTSIYMPFTTFRTIFNKGDKADLIVFSFHGLPTEKANDNFENNYRARLNGNHHAAPDDEGSIWIWNQFTQSMQMNTGIGIIQTALWIIGLFTLLSGIVGVSNIMLITVKERTREFGIRKAIGATPWAILKLIIVESVVITTFFGYIGMVLGIAANEYMDATIGHTTVNSGIFEATMFLNPTVGIDVCIETTVLMIIAGTIAGLIPARKAARIRPIEALRAE